MTNLRLATKPDALKTNGRVVPGIGIVVEHVPGLDWVHPGIAVYQTESIGLGLVALDLIARDSTVILFGGKLMTWKEISSLPKDMLDIPYQVDDELFFGIHRRDEIGIGERINHSCDPNCGFSSEMKLVALRDILPGQPVTMDYATCTSMDQYRLVCRCGSPNCRGVVTGEDWKLPDLRRRLLPFYQPYLREKVRNQIGAGFRSRLGALFQHAGSLLARSA
jgi:hypothetical protein